MQKKRTNKFFSYKHYSDREFKIYLREELKDSQFENHVSETASNLNLDKSVVRDVLLDMALKILQTAQKSIIKNQQVKLNIYGFYFLVTRPGITKLTFKSNS